jgi:tetratricopeptide (TPR) repeat protein
MTPFGIDIGAPPPTPQRSGNTARGFVFGVMATGALLFVAYFVFDLMARTRNPAPPREATAARTVASSARPSPSASLVVKLDRADVEYARDTDAGFERADGEYVAALEALGQPPSDPVLAARALLGRARVAVTRADYLRLEAREVSPARQQAPADGRDASAQLVRAEQFLASARELAPTSVDVDLVFGDYFRVMGERASATRYVAKLESEAEGRPELTLLKAALPLEEPGADAAEAARRLAELPADAADLPRSRYLRAVALRRAGKSEEAASLLVELVASIPDHGPGKRLLTEISGKMSPASQDAVKVASAEAVAVPVVEARPAEPPPAPRREEPKPRPAEPERPAPPARPQPGQDYDTLMTQGYKLLEGGRSRDARAFFEEAAARKDRSPEPWANIGWCFMDQRDYGQAVSYFKRSLERSPRYADALYGVAEAYERSGQTVQALEAYKHYLEVHPNGRKAEMAQRKIERLR